jgi:hypothetical protein
MRLCYRCYKSLDEKDMVSGLHLSCFCSWFELPSSDEFLDVVARYGDQTDGEGDWRQINTSFFHGKFRKYSASVGNYSYILRFLGRIGGTKFHKKVKWFTI